MISATIMVPVSDNQPAAPFVAGVANPEKNVLVSPVIQRTGVHVACPNVSKEA
jgi:hypothetical protein